MKFQQEFQLLKNIGKFTSGQKITGITISKLDGSTVIVDLKAAPEWFLPLRDSFAPVVGDIFYFVDENMEVNSRKIDKPLDQLDKADPIITKMRAGNFFRQPIDALNAAARIKETIGIYNQDLANAEGHK